MPLYSSIGLSVEKVDQYTAKSNAAHSRSRTPRIGRKWPNCLGHFCSRNTRTKHEAEAAAAGTHHLGEAGQHQP